MEETRPTSTYCEPTVPWRLRRAGTDTARATVVPRWHGATLLWWINERLEGAVDVASLDAAISRGEPHPRCAACGWLGE